MLWFHDQVRDGMAGWIYDDGYFPDHTTQNIACSRATPSGCWGHRDAILRDTAATACEQRCAVGAGYSPTGFPGGGPGGMSQEDMRRLIEQMKAQQKAPGK